MEVTNQVCPAPWIGNQRLLDSLLSLQPVRIFKVMVITLRPTHGLLSPTASWLKFRRHPGPCLRQTAERIAGNHAEAGYRHLSWSQTFFQFWHFASCNMTARDKAVLGRYCRFVTRFILHTNRVSTGTRHVQFADVGRSFVRPAFSSKLCRNVTLWSQNVLFVLD